ncbi:hypothetical protein [Tomitella fengzijianii]|uniref:Lipoprotein n=1 Tax=Tomitella fengzijianii TaxID=2597660 RepID=A0A516X4Q1_9ACTN|nr:hypothetical protein [Tomitella fengzijianii]QDQ98052.1 hypothetical protein FO059_12915 [Tomitella fengzijianii]
MNGSVRAAVRTTAVGIAAVGAVAALAGCGSSDQDAGGASAAQSAPAGSATPGTPSSGAAPSASGGPADAALYDTAAHRLITEAMAGDKFIECTAKDSDDTVTAYVHGEDRMRIDSGTGPDAGHVLAVDGVTYLWSDDQPGGMKTTGPASDGMKKMIEGMGVDLDAARRLGGEQAAGIEDGAALGCTEYSGDASVFAVPEGREFDSVDDALGEAPVDLPGAVPGQGGGD